jgi:hypothetical protein
MSHLLAQHSLGSPDPNSRICLSCGEPIGHLRVDARFCGDTCRQRYRRGHVFQPPPVTRGRLCQCDRHLLDRDEDGDLICLKSGRMVGRVGDRLTVNRTPASSRVSRIPRPEPYRKPVALRVAA